MRLLQNPAKTSILMTRNLSESNVEAHVKNFYDTKGWSSNPSGVSSDAELWEDLRECAQPYVSACRLKLLKYLPERGDLILDAASGPIQYEEYFEYSRGFKKRVCVDISEKALALAQEKLGARGEYVKASLLDLPFPNDHFDAIVSLHTIYHIDQAQQEKAVRELIRVAKPGKNIVIVYSNPDRILSQIKNVFARRKANSSDPNAPIYFFAHPIRWWNRFSDQCEIKVEAWRSFTAKDSKFLLPNNSLGKMAFRSTLAFENKFPKLAARIGAYPVIVLTKK